MSCVACTDTYCPCSNHASEPKGPHYYWATSKQEGGCNFCNRHITPDGGVDHEVLVMKGPQLVVRACLACATSFMGAVLKPRARRSR